MRKKQILRRRFLLIISVFGLLFFSFSRTIACSPAARSDCKLENQCSDGWDGDDCIHRAELVSIPESDIAGYNEDCSEAPGAFDSQQAGVIQGQPSYKLWCYYEAGMGIDNPWEDAKVTKLCSCLADSGDDEGGGSSNPEADELAEELGLKDISIEGIFAGDFSANEMIEIGILLLFGILTVVILVLIIINGMKIAGAGADEQKKQMATKGLINAIIGFVIIIASYLILSIFFSFFGLSPFKDVLPIECEGLEGEALERCLNLVEED